MKNKVQIDPDDELNVTDLSNETEEDEHMYIWKQY